MKRAIYLGLGALLALNAPLGPVQAAEAESSELDLSKEALLSADEVVYDNEAQRVEARGNVEIVQGDRVLKADKIIYDVAADTVRAEGNIALLEPTGDVVFADNMELENELKTGAIRDLKILFTDNSRLAAHDAIREDENRTVMNKAVFTSCEPCKEDPTRAPIWQAKADKVIHDRQEKTITYRNAFLEFFGVPVIYTPYFAHPDPTVDRQSGFLAPSVFNSSTLGYGVKVPYYYVIDEDKDMTVTPTITSKEGVQMAAEYRQAVESGSFQFDGSLTYVDKVDNNNNETGGQEFQGHIRGDGEFRIDDAWVWGYDIFRTTHDTYLKKYDISDADTLTSTAYLQGQRGRNFSLLSAYSFQGLTEEDVSGETPIVPAWWNYSYVGDANSYGGRFDANADVLAIYRTDGQDTNRLSLEGGYLNPYTTANGQVITLDTSIRGDLYYPHDELANPADPSSATADDSFTGRLVPSVSVKWQYPFVRQSGSIRQVVEPIAEAVWSDVIGDNGTPNEDSLSFEFDDTNLFGSNRYAGLDEVETGARLNYGLNLSAYGASGGYTTLLFGQSYHFDKDTGFQDGTGLEDRFSDYVARLEIRPADYLQFVNRVRLDHDSLFLARNEISMKLGTVENWFDLGYVYLRDDPNGITQDRREEIYVAGKVKLSEFWSAYGSYRRNLVNDGNSIDGRIGLEYLDECFGIALEARRSFTRDRDVEPETRFGVRIRLLPFN
ncbi:MAG: organic solvent tolerance protein [Sneathiella sp.]|uniref:LPS-assembly protein LptD n=1 Tax=Sneathiella sp. TaxID=1964365 RepID=UPI000C58CF26|nr:LPS assembly protein LptD [Sneathiella sp.]MAZ01907.1 organic solvent tolerance protein [Sneathiella sp.]